MVSIKDVMQKVLKNVTPTKMEKKKIDAIINLSKQKINNELKRRGINAEVFVGGSIAKGTWIKGQGDVDFFIKFDISYKDKDIGKILEDVIKSVFKKYTLLHGTRDYCKVNYKGHELEFVPVLDIARPSDAKNSMDASLFHVEYVRNKIFQNPELANQIRIFKAFTKAQGIYGAETHISGLSGYVVELLMIHYKTFENMVNSAEDMKPPIFIDIEKHYKNEREIVYFLGRQKLKSPIILIDPVLKTRNASAALEYKTFSHLILALRLFARKPSISFFKEKKLTERDIRTRSKSRGTILVIKKIKKKYPKEDIFLAKLKRKLEKVCVELERNGIEVYEHGYIVGDKEISVFFEMETIRLSKYKKHYGPPVWINKKHFDAFIKKWKKVYVDNVNLVCDIKRKETNIRKMVMNILSEELKNV